jgi:hypothetical protein
MALLRSLLPESAAIVAGLFTGEELQVKFSGRCFVSPVTQLRKRLV